ncbi:peptidyl-prolyl cis-trans isomerase (rotamase) [Catellatospora methionotrophica]|uniref:Peptidyl-prolyl cis-trans isomerase (Rotamase) n=1 Tax=Catellatospora methionotrophica TaxID=121620 RepID=A0A8J3LAM4_9ACTN|nr:peptidylprolyl isomerase [Catellatospora methionotrophica]GIG17423.1 peptidyl-prolyl cis-trans isomerase (rotamase) [Catellatospora methionotrophica]
MASSNTRQRKLARAKVDRQMVRRADQERRSRQLKAVFGGLFALVLVGVLGAWGLGAFDAKPVDTVAETCAWNPLDVAGNANLKDAGKPATSGMPTSGTAAMTIALNSGNVVAELDRTAAPCGAASLKYLADSGFYNDTKCHKLTHAEGDFALACGDPSGTGSGGAAYSWWVENPPAAEAPSAAPSTDASASAAATPSPAAATAKYPAGTIAMTPNLNGSQFVIFYKASTTDTPYSIVGKVTSGLDVVEKIAQAGTTANEAGEDTKPKQDVVVKTLTVVDTTPASPSAPAAPASPSAPAASGAATTPKPSASTAS